MGAGDAELLLFQFPGFAHFEVALAEIGGFGGIHSGFEGGFFQEVAPAFVAIGGALAFAELLHGGFGVLTTVDDLHDAGGFVGADVVPDERVR